jgi:hypothetical protein
MKENEEGLEQQIKVRAFQMWIEEGQPSGRDREHLARAKEELLAYGFRPSSGTAKGAL